VLILSQYAEFYAARCLKAGAKGCLSKHASVDELNDAIRKLHAGGIYVGGAMRELLAVSVASDDGEQPPHLRLSDREYEVMLRIASGRKQSEMAREFNLSIHTVGTYRARMLEKLNLANDVQVTQYVLAYELMQNPIIPVPATAGPTRDEQTAPRQYHRNSPG
jgi:DNA-binding NarL/FixJ family response regulator